MSVFSVVNAFNAGELSPLLLARPDLEQYSRGCRTLENFLPTPYGTAERRPGTQLMWALPAENGTSGKLARFSYDANNTYLLLFLPDRLLAFKPGTLAGWHSNCVVASGNNYPWAGKNLDAIQTAQINDMMVVVHPDVAPQCVKRTSDMQFSLESWKMTFPPVLDWNTDTGKRFYCGYTSGNGRTLTTYGWTGFASDDVGRLLVIRVSKGTSESGEFKSNGQTSNMYVRGAWTLTTHGSWNGTLRLWRRPPGNAAVEQVGTDYSSEGDYNVAASGDEAEDGVYYYLTMENYSKAESGTLKACQWSFSCPGAHTTGVVKIASVAANRMSATVDFVRPLEFAGYTSDWCWGAFSTSTGYPRATCFHQQRLWFGGTKAEPQRLWGSRVDGYDDFMPVGGEEDSAMDVTLTGGDASRIAWLGSKDALLAGTMDEEWSIAPSNGMQGALTTENIYIRRTSAYGSAWPPCVALAEDRMVFAQRDRERLRAMVYSWEQDGYVAEDLTLLAEHVTRSGVRCLAVQKSPDTVVWCALEDGTLASCTCDSSQRVNGWARHPRAAGEVLSLCVLPTPSGEDRLYLLTLVSGRLAVERMFPRRFPGFGEAVFLDMAVPVYSGTVGDSPELGFFHETDGEILFHSDTDTNVPPLAVPWPDDVRVGLLTPGLEYAVTWALRGSELRSDSQAADGQSYVSTEGLDFSPIAWSENGVQRQGPQVGWVGLPYASVLSPMPAEMQTQRGLSMLRQKTVCRMLVDTYGSVGGEARADAGKWQPVLPRDAEEAVQLPASEKDEVVIAAPLGGHARRTKVEIRQTLPLPLNVAGLALELSSEGV